MPRTSKCRAPRRRSATATATVAAIGLAVVLALAGCEDGCPSGQRSEITGYTQVWIPGTKVGSVTTPGHFSSTPNFACVEDR